MFLLEDVDLEDVTRTPFLQEIICFQRDFGENIRIASSFCLQLTKMDYRSAPH